MANKMFYGLGTVIYLFIVTIKIKYWIMKMDHANLKKNIKLK